MKKYLYPANIMTVKKDFESWSVIACDQFTSNAAYWKECRSLTDGKATAYDLILPEIYLEKDNSRLIATVNDNMNRYLASDVFTTYENSMIYVERTQPDNRVRHGIVGMVDLEDYSYEKSAKTLIRATEQTVPERLPVRIEIRKNAPLELTHVMLLINDPDDSVISVAKNSKGEIPKIYDFDLMQGGGHIKGYLLNEKYCDMINAALAMLAKGSDPLLFAVGDGNHSLATAKECYRLDPTPLSRYALVEVVNIHDQALDFEPIYRVIFGVDTGDVISEAKKFFASEITPDTQNITIITKEGEKIIAAPKDGSLPVSQVQRFLEDYMSNHTGCFIDYIHGIDEVNELCTKENTVGFVFDTMKKSELFESVSAGGSLVRKAFSMGEARDKRYYLEARRIK